MRRLPRYIHELPEWPAFRWDQDRLAGTLAAVRHRQGRLVGHMEALGFPLQQEATLAALTEEAVKSSAIEGEQLEAQQVRSSLARRLGMDVAGVDVVDRRVEGVAEMMLDATRNYDQPLTPDRLFGWHASLFPGGRNGMRKLRAGAWRDDSTGPMQVVSGPVGRERVHFEGPAAERLDREMNGFLGWLNAGTGPPVSDDLLRAGLAHLWFVTIHPFDDGNGRIARAITDLALARSERTAQRFYGMSAQIRRERNDYYDILERTQKGALDVTAWMEWFLGCFGRTIDNARETVAAVLRKARFRETLAGVPINERQRLMLNRLLDGFEGKLTTSKWAAIARCSPDTALRDIHGLVERGVLVRNPGAGRSTSYSLATEVGRASGEAVRSLSQERRFSLANYIKGVEKGWPEEDVYRIVVSGLPRGFHALSFEEQRAALEERVPPTGTRWDALFAAVVEHVARQHGHEAPAWVDEPERFLESTWVVSRLRPIRMNALMYSPAAFLRHGALPDPRDLDGRGGERHQWTPWPSLF